MAICQRNERALNSIGDAFGINRRYTSYTDMLADTDIDAVHINTPMLNHAEQTVQALLAGKHVACTLPMATTIEDCRRIVEAARSSGKTYMMMETVVFSREYLYVRDLLDNGEIGNIQFLQGAHQQEMAGWPGYWEGLPPMHYATHAVSPLLALAGRPAESVVCQGSGRISAELTAKYGSPFAVETALIRIAHSPLVAEVTRSLFETAREYIESFAVYGDNVSFEWGQVQGDDPVIFRGEQPERVKVPDYAGRLPEEIRRYTTKGVYDEQHAHLSFKQGSGHGGSHPHLVHEFVRSILDKRPPLVDAVTAANWTSVGLCAHESAMRGGERLPLPIY